MNTIECYDLGRAPYRETWELQAAIQKRLIEEKLQRNAMQKASPDTPPSETSATSPDVLLFVEHPHVYTLGKSGDVAHLLKNEQELIDLNATYMKIDRGGDITYHGPGQVVGYPILDLDRYFTDIHKYLRFLEETMIRVCHDYGVTATRIDKLTGVWVDDAKICAFGIKCSRWITMHGFALNVNTQLDYFGHIIPCGINNKAVTSLSELLNRHVDEEEVKQRITYHLGKIFDASISRMEGLPPETKQVNGWARSPVS